MKSKWLPTFPLHAAHWLADPRVQMLSPAARTELLEALLRSWMLGKGVAVSPKIAEAYADLWPEYEAVLKQHVEAYERRQKQTDAARRARHGSSVTVSVTENATEPDEPEEQSLSQQEPEPEPEPYPEPKPEPEPRERKPRGWKKAPRDFALSADLVDYGLDKGLTEDEVRDEFEAFMRCDFKTPHTDARDTFMNWLLREAKSRGRTRSVSRPQTAAGRTMSNVEEFLKQSGAL